MPEEIEKAIQEMPRDAEVIDLLNKLSGEGLLPARQLQRPRMRTTTPRFQCEDSQVVEV